MPVSREKKTDINWCTFVRSFFIWLLIPLDGLLEREKVTALINDSFSLYNNENTRTLAINNSNTICIGVVGCLFNSENKFTERKIDSLLRKNLDEWEAIQQKDDVCAGVLKESSTYISTLVERELTQSFVTCPPNRFG